MTTGEELEKMIEDDYRILQRAIQWHKKNDQYLSNLKPKVQEEEIQRMLHNRPSRLEFLNKYAPAYDKENYTRQLTIELVVLGAAMSGAAVVYYLNHQ